MVEYPLGERSEPDSENFKPGLLADRQPVLIRPDSATALHDELCNHGAMDPSERLRPVFSPTAI